MKQASGNVVAEREGLVDTTLLFSTDLNLRQVMFKSPCLCPKGDVRSGVQG